MVDREDVQKRVIKVTSEVLKIDPLSIIPSDIIGMSIF